MKFNYRKLILIIYINITNNTYNMPPKKVATLCKGITVKKNPCKLKTKNDNGYCQNHQEQIPKVIKKKVIKKSADDTKKPMPRISVRRSVKDSKPKTTIKKKKFVEEKPADCPICLESLKKEKNPLDCGHWVHLKCVEQSLNAECPFCRKPVKVSEKAKEKINKNRAVARREYNEDMIRNYPREIPEGRGAIPEGRTAIRDTGGSSFIRSQPQTVRDWERTISMLTERIGIQELIRLVFSH